MIDIAQEIQAFLDRCVDRRFNPPHIHRVNVKHVPVQLLERALSEIIHLRTLLQEKTKLS
jgi:hypothetical protein